MSIYSRYQEAIKLQLILNHEEMNFKSDSNYTYMLEHVDNNLGHNIDNYHLACLECNLKRRRQTDEKFLFTKQLNIVKTV